MFTLCPKRKAIQTLGGADGALHPALVVLASRAADEVLVSARATHPIVELAQVVQRVLHRDMNQLAEKADGPGLA